MGWKVTLAAAGITLIAGYFLYTQFSPQRILRDPTIQPLLQDNDTARQEIQQLKQQATEHERQAAYWRTEASKHQKTIGDLKATVQRLQDERQAMKAVQSVQEAWQELQRFGF